MKRNFHPFGFLSALFIHIVLIGAIFYALTRQNDTELIRHEPDFRFSVTLSELPELSGSPDESPEEPLRDNTLQPSDRADTSVDQSEKPDKSLPKPDDSSSVSVIPNKIAESVKRHYGDEFFALTSDEQKYILENLKTIRKINEVIGNRLLRSRPADEIDPTDSNIVEFYLYPDGSISDLYLYEDRQNNLLDSLTMDTIRLAHTKYPKPAVKTLIRIRVWILVKE